ncbi:MAG: hypothetical protein QG571_1403 [Pseudomonadota bacterium]|nr:hypothetical protein [Pseudomonadota bacterium]
MRQRLLGNLGWQPDQRVIVADAEAVDLGAVQVALVRQGADDVARQYAVLAPDFETESRMRCFALAALARTTTARGTVAVASSVGETCLTRWR